MMRKAFLMSVKPSKIDEYKRSHNPIWPELYDVLKKHGINNYSIFHSEETNHLFGYLEIENEEEFEKLSQNKICHKWWLYMKEFLIPDSNDRIKAKEEEIREIFHID
ncbi:MAG: L-rhamnose mutarotase [Victivallaceae bacterium]|nr:L-rhamnose mutarotase [Victivallaceae bacterium]MDD4180828.1 L-rhamnose mutarotase [Victivallaceae bacterium]